MQFRSVCCVLCLSPTTIFSSSFIVIAFGPLLGLSSPSVSIPFLTSANTHTHTHTCYKQFAWQVVDYVAATNKQLNNNNSDDDDDQSRGQHWLNLHSLPRSFSLTQLMTRGSFVTAVTFVCNQEHWNSLCMCVPTLPCSRLTGEIDTYKYRRAHPEED